MGWNMKQELDSKYWDAKRGTGDTTDSIADINVAFTLRRVLQERSIGSLVELGCGAGRNFPVYNDLQTQATCIDFSPARIEMANLAIERFGFSTIAARVGDMVRDAVPARRADAVVMTYVLQHMNGRDVTTVVSKIKAFRCRWLFLLEYYSEPFADLLAHDTRRRTARGGTPDMLNSTFTSHPWDYPSIVGLPYKYIPIIQKRTCSLLIFDKGGK
jgi:SAM-dependent methyltransferase